MPFTLSHTAFAVPFYRKYDRYINFVGLFIGTMAPDFEYFIHFEPYSKYGHTLGGMFFYNLPISIIIAFIFVNIVKNQIILNSPNSICKQYAHLLDSRFRIMSIRDFVVYIYSFVIGNLSHLLWDSFTHKSAYFVQKIMFLQSKIMFNIPVYKAIQHGSSLLGILILVCFLIKIRNSSGEFKVFYKKNKIIYWLKVVGISILILFLKIVFMDKSFSITRYGTLIVSSMSSFLLSTVFVSIMNNLVVNNKANNLKKRI